MINELYQVLRPTIFKRSKDDPEIAHEKALGLLEWCDNHPWTQKPIASIFQVRDPRLEQNLMGLTFPHPVGLAAGFSKNAEGAITLSSIFGFLELGTVVPMPQAGNPRPRMFRLPEDKGLINRMGFNSLGMDAAAKKRKQQGRLSVPVGISIGKNMDTPLGKAVEDYKSCLERLYDCGDYFVVNVSSPNTKNLRDLQGKESLTELLRALILLSRRLAAEKGILPKPILVKIAPDLKYEQIDDVLDVCRQLRIPGIVAVNTTTSRDGLVSRNRNETGGYSGSKLFQKSRAIVSYIRKRSPWMVIIAVGGVSYGVHAIEMLLSGANLVQMYTGLVYEGPGAPKAILCDIKRMMDNERLDQIGQLTGR